MEKDQRYRKKWDKTLYTMTKGEWIPKHIGASGCDIRNSIFNIDQNKRTYMNVVIVEEWGRDRIFIHYHYALGVKWVLACNIY